MNKFEYDFKKCGVCDSEMVSHNHGFILKCCNGCCNYYVDMQGGTAVVELFGKQDEDHLFAVGLHEKNLHNNRELIEKLKYDEQKLLESLRYWRENDRYLMKIMSRGDSN